MPTVVSFPEGFQSSPMVLAMGSDRSLSSSTPSISMLHRGQALVFPNVGQWLLSQNPNGFYRRLSSPAAIAVDRHADSLSARQGQDFAETYPATIHPIQCHHAQLAACLVDHQVPRQTTPVLGLVFGEAGYGDDGMLWGGEFFVGNYAHVQRVATLKPIALLGGTAAIAEPWRSTYAHLISAFDWDDMQAVYGDLALLRFLHNQPRAELNRLWVTGMNAPRTTSVHRWFDAVVAALGQEPSIQPQDWAMAERSPYPFEVDAMRTRQGQRLPYLDPRPMWYSLLEDLSRGESAAVMSARFQVGFAHAIAALAVTLANKASVSTIALAGSMFDKAQLQQRIQGHLEANGYCVLSGRPAQDVDVMVGQLAIAAAQTLHTPAVLSQPRLKNSAFCS
jgi:hydrogenase maturation protein HypF